MPGSNLLFRRLVTSELNFVGIVIGVVRMSFTAAADAFGFGNRVAISTTGNSPEEPSTAVAVMPAAAADRMDQQCQRGQESRDDSEHVQRHRHYLELD